MEEKGGSKGGRGEWGSRGGAGEGAGGAGEMDGGREGERER